LDICCGSSILKIRELASLAHVSLHIKANLDVDEYLRKWVFRNEQLSHNKCHGKILQFHHMIKSCLTDERLKQGLLNSCHHLRPQVESLLSHLYMQTSSSLIRTAILEVALSLTKAGFPIQNDLVTPNEDQSKIDVIDDDLAVLEAKANIWKPLEAKVLGQYKILLGQSIEDVTDDLKSSVKNRDERLALFETKNGTEKYSNLLDYLKIENDPQCLEALLKLILKVTNQESSLNDVICETEAEVIRLPTGGDSCTNSRLRGLWMEFSGILLKHYWSQISQQMIQNWIKCFMVELETNKSDSDIKMSLAKVIKANKASLFQDQQQMERPNDDGNGSFQTGMEAVFLYSSLWLVTEDEADVRKIMSDTFPFPLASMMLFQEIVDKLYNRGFQKLLLQFKRLLVTGDRSSVNADEEMAFDKSETNAWRENHLLLKIIDEKLSKNADLSSFSEKNDGNTETTTTLVYSLCSQNI